MVGESNDELCEGVWTCGQKGEAREFVRVRLASERCTIARLVFKAVERDRSSVNEGVREHEPCCAIPVAQLPEVGVATEEDQEDPARGLT